MPDVPGNDALIAHVRPDSPAGKAGLRFGDVLLKIDGRDVTPWRTEPGILPLSRFWQQPAGTHLRLTVLRGKKKITTDVVLRNILGPVEK
jgi:regulator of sigma E protease